VIKELEVFSAQPGAPELALGNLMANDEPLQIRDITGIGPVAAELTTSPLATRGSLLQGGTTGERSIGITLGLTPDWAIQSVGQLRQQLYRYFVPEQWVKLRFTSDELPVVDIEGYVESVEPLIFAQDPEVIVSVLCPKPDFIHPVALTHSGVAEAVPTIVTVAYDGTVDAGFELRIGEEAGETIVGAVEVKVAQTDGIEQLFVVDPAGVDGEKYLRISSVPGAKRVENVAWFDDSATNSLGRATITPDNKWPVLRPGLNTIEVVSDELTVTEIPWELAYFPRYVGF
jgi:hypothetical protein